MVTIERLKNINLMVMRDFLTNRIALEIVFYLRGICRHIYCKNKIFFCSFFEILRIENKNISR